MEVASGDEYISAYQVLPIMDSENRMTVGQMSPPSKYLMKRKKVGSNGKYDPIEPDCEESERDWYAYRRYGIIHIPVHCVILRTNEAEHERTTVSREEFKKGKGVYHDGDDNAVDYFVRMYVVDEVHYEDNL